MRILLVTNNYLPYSGGVVSSILATVEHLRDRGHEPFIVTLDFESHRSEDPEYVHRLWCPIKFRYKTNYMALPMRMGAQIDSYIAEKKPDIVHVHHPYLLGPKAVKSAQAKGIPVIFTYHTLYEAYAHYVPLPRAIVAPVARAVSIDFSNSVSTVIAPSTAIKDYLKDHGVTVPIRVVPSGIDMRFFGSPDKIYTDVEQKPLRLLVVGRFAREKNISLALNVFAQLPQDGSITITLVGYGPEWHRMQSYAYEVLRLSPHLVTFIHKPSKELLADCYRKADVFLFTSSTDTQGLVIPEALASGCPVVSVDGPGQRDSIIQGYNGCIVDDAAQMARTIMQFASDKTQLSILSSHARLSAQKYRSDQLIEQLIACYESVLKK